MRIRCQQYLKYHGGQLVPLVQGWRLRNIVLPCEFECQLAVNTRGYIWFILMHISCKEASHLCVHARNWIGFTARDRVKVSAPFSVRCIRATATYESVSLYSEPFFKLSSIRLELKCGFVCPKYSSVPVSRNLCVRKWGKTEEKMEAEGMGLISVLWHEMSVKNTSPKYIRR